VLEKVAAFPISTWYLKDDAAKVRHMGPMAQDLYAAFGLGDSDKAINSVDADGVALAAIQGLNQKVKTQEAEIVALKDRIASLESQQADMAALKTQLAALRAAISGSGTVRLAEVR